MNSRSLRPGRRLLAAVVLGLLVLPTGCAEKQVSEGIYLAQQGDYQRAIDAFRAALERSPESAIAHYNLGYALSADARTKAASGRFEGTTESMREASRRFGEAIALDPDRYATEVATARQFNFTELYNLAIDTSRRGALDDADRILRLAAIATDDALNAQRVRVLRLQIEMSQALATGGAEARERYMRVLAELEGIKEDGLADDALVYEIENTLARARALIGVR